MIRSFAKGTKEQLSKNFWVKDFDCKCAYPECRVTYVEEDLVDALEFTFEMVDGIWISSGFRCTRHNEEEGGKPGSQHLVGKAADVHPGKVPVQELFVVMEKIPVFNNGGLAMGKTFVHGDVRGYRARWTY